MSLVSKVSFQLYSARNFPPLEAQLVRLQQLGFHNVEPFGGLYGDPNALAQRLKAHHLHAPTGHFGMDQLEGDFDGALKVAQALQMRVVICPYILPEHRPKDGGGWRAWGERLASVGHKLAKHGLSFAWHNHDFEFAALADGSRPLDHILSADESLQWEADIGWIVRAGEDPVAWLDKYHGRIAALHVKDIAPHGQAQAEDGWADIGHGTIDWARIIPAGIKAGAAYLVIEHDNPSDFERFASRSMAAIKGWTF